MKIAIYPGSFDPFTLGHMDILQRTSRLFDRVYAAILINGAKTPCFSLEERKEMMNICLEQAGICNVFVESSSGLLVDYVKQKKACAVVRGLRDGADMAYEARLDSANRHLYAGFETVCLFSRPELNYISASMVREIGAYGGDISGLVPDAIKNIIAERLKHR